MPMQEQIVVQPYAKGPKGGFRPDPQIPVRTAEAGRLRAERIMANGGRIVGVEVVQVSGDPDTGDFGEPVYLARLGELPDLPN